MASDELTPPADSRPISFAPGYMIRDGGEIWSNHVAGRKRKFQGPGRWHIMKLTRRRRTGHLHVGLTIDGKQRVFLVHRLVLEVFVGPCPPGLECCHDDGNPANNYVSNLGWGTREKNIADKKRHGVAHGPIGERQANAKLKNKDIPQIVRLSRSGIGYGRIATTFGVDRSIIYGIMKQKLWTHITRDLF